MRISYLELRNYRKFRDLKLQFPDGVVGILGLNGSGKTTIIEAMAWALFGNEEEVVRTSRESIRSSSAGPRDTVKAILEFDLDDVEYRIEREMGGRSLSMKVTLHSSSGVVADTDKAVRAAVQKLIGMDYKAFFTSVFARQKELDDLQEMQPAKRKEIVLRMLRIDGLDAIIRSVRADKNAASERIRGAEGLLLDEEGNDREVAVLDRLGRLRKEHADAEKAVVEAEGVVAALVVEVSGVRERRDALRKDFDALNAAVADLRANSRALSDRRGACDALAVRINEAEQALKRMPVLEGAEQDWKKASAAKDSMEREKGRFERRELLKKDVVAIEADAETMKARISALDASQREEDDVKASIDSTRDDVSESASRRDGLAEKIAASRARMDERKEGLAARLNKLAEVEGAGDGGICPTCERPLGETYPLLVGKLREEVESDRIQIEKEGRTVSDAQRELKGLESRLTALDKKLEHQEKRLGELRRDTARRESMEDELRRVLARRDEKMRAVDDLGEIRYSPDAHASAREDFERLKRGHEEFIRLSERRLQLERARSDIEEHREAVKGLEGEREKLSERVKVLEDRGPLYEAALSEFERRSEELGAAKDRSGNAKAIRERTKAEREATEREFDAIHRSKESIGRLRKQVDELGTLEEVFVSFKNHLISRIAPTLADITSGILDLMTDGKYSTVSLDDDYQMSVEDGGLFHPLDRFSGGEGDLANLSLRLAISKIVAERTGTNQVNFLILDEIFGSLDPSRKRSAMTALSGLSAQFRQVMLITHVEDVKDLLTNIISVEEMPDGSSTARLVS